MPEVYESPIEELLKRLAGASNTPALPDKGANPRLEWNPDASIAPPPVRAPFAPGRSIGPTPPLPPPPPLQNARTTPSSSPYTPSPADLAPEIDGEQAPDPLTGGNSVDWNQVQTSNASLDSPFVPPQIERNINPPIPPPQVRLDSSNQGRGSVSPPQATPSPEESKLVVPPTPQLEQTPEAIPTHKRDPNDILLEQYREPIMEMAKAARARDMARMDSPQARGEASGMIWQGLLGRDSGLTGRGADLLRKSSFDPIYGESLEQQGKGAEQLGKGQIASEKMDPNSPVSEATRIAMLASPMTEDWAVRAVKQGEFDNVTQAKAWMYRQSKQLHAAGMESYMSNIMKGGDFSKQAAEKGMIDVLADKHSWEAKQIKLAFETDQALKAALTDKDHPASLFVKQFLRQMDRQGYDSTPGIENMNGLQAGAALGMLDPALGVMKRRVEHQYQVEQQREVVPGVLSFRTHRVNNGFMDVDVLPAGANAEQEKIRFSNTQAALQTANEIRDESTRLARFGATTQLGTRGAQLGSKLRQLHAQLNAIGDTEGMKEVNSLYGTLEKGDVKIGSVTANTDKLLNAVFGSVANQAGTNAPRVIRHDVENAAKDPSDIPLPHGPGLGYEKASPTLVGPVSSVKIKDPYNNGQETWASKQIIGGKHYYWLSNGKQVILNPKTRPQTDDPAKFEVR